MDGPSRRPTDSSLRSGTPSLGEVPSGGARALWLLWGFSKVTRCKSGTLSGRYQKNGYVLSRRRYQKNGYVLSRRRYQKNGYVLSRRRYQKHGYVLSRRRYQKNGYVLSRRRYQKNGYVLSRRRYQKNGYVLSRRHSRKHEYAPITQPYQSGPTTCRYRSTPCAVCRTRLTSTPSGSSRRFPLNC